MLHFQSHRYVCFVHTLGTWKRHDFEQAQWEPSSRMSAMTPNHSSKTVPNKIMKQYYEQWAFGGASLIVTEGTLITCQGYLEQRIGRGMEENYRFRSRRWQQNLFTALAPHPEAPEQIMAGVPVYAPSAISARRGKFRHINGAPGYVTPTEIAGPTILIAQYKQAAINAQKASFDSVELLAGNGYLPEQFLNSTSNKCTDKWDGSVENCTCFALETLKALIEVHGPNVVIKLGPFGGNNDVGMPLQEAIDTFKYLFCEIKSTSSDFRKKWGIPHDVLEIYSPFLPNTHIFVNGGISPAEAEELVSIKKAAGVFFGVPWLTHPDLGKRTQAGKELNNTPDSTTFYVVANNPTVGYTDYKEAMY
ncbi:hypothetical protein DFH07DRAFT_776310 [Mycena maculata]|uniref:NADH:flavin oxidoreductase/NADH oxidase N-terminal domain-containing protein n=1 Tax=Mycena maculata TaxID=230809 RepID=A0AAD7N6S2_9AGAR|nr:hypothetical protein DFH07DRAFT_776310 [Mycena maculata]